MAGGHGRHGHEIGRCRAAPRREIARFFFKFRQNESAELFGGKFVIYRAVRGLHGQEPIDFPFHFGQKIGHLAAGLGNIEADFLDLRSKIFPRPEHRAHGHSGVDRVFIVIAGVVPAFCAVLAHVLAGDAVQPGVFQMAWLRG